MLYSPWEVEIAQLCIAILHLWKTGYLLVQTLNPGLFFSLNRLQLCYKYKFVQGHVTRDQVQVYEIMLRFHPNKDKHDWRKTITFNDMVRWMQEGHRNVHWDGPYHNRCYPCQVDYDYYVKLETQDRDSDFIIKNKLSSQGIGMHRNKAQKKTMATLSLYMPIYKELTSKEMKFLRNRLQPDLGMFGYSFNESTMTGTCGNDDISCC